MFKKVTIEYSDIKINKEVLSSHICDIINQNIQKEDNVEYESKENYCVA